MTLAALTLPQRPRIHPPVSGAALAARALTRTFGTGSAQTTALNSVSLDFKPSQLVVLMGPSGSGKSTLLAVLSGLLRPDSGTVRTRGCDLWQLSDVQRKRFRLQHFGFIFQGYNLFPALTARQQLELILDWGQGVRGREARRRAEDMLALLGLAGKGNLRPAQLSGGEKQRVAIGRALLKEPAFCFADEPTSALDWAHGRQVVELLRQAADRGTTVVVVSHDVRLVPFADRVLHLEDGCLSEQRKEEDSH